MSLDIDLYAVRCVNIGSLNITHNLIEMADKAGIYECLWRPEDIQVTTANQLIEPLKLGLQKLKANPEYFKQFNPGNGWGTYEGLVTTVETYLQLCIDNPDAEIKVYR